jgi:formylglycine-generating enzyme required for sulfatase activity
VRFPVAIISIVLYYICMENDMNPTSRNLTPRTAAGGIRNFVGLAILITILLLLLLSGCDEVPTKVPPTAIIPSNACTEIGQTWASPVDGMTLVCVPAGEFVMGTDDGSGEGPAHTVILDAYWIDQSEVTNAMYQKCVGVGGCVLPEHQSSDTREDYYVSNQYTNYPVIGVSWEEALSYCQWAGRSLPTEAQWEKAARGTDGRIYPWGSQELSCQLANYRTDASSGSREAYCVRDTVPVGSYPGGKSPYGADDMAGNVWEWVADWDDGQDYSPSPAINPAGPASGIGRISRGGSWYDLPDELRSTVRFGNYSPDYRNEVARGFRCAQSAAAP